MLVLPSSSDEWLLSAAGISIGRLIHTEDVLLGPGMLFAYSLESKVAKHSRVIVDPQNMEFLLHAAGEYPASHHDADHETHYVSSLLTKDDDGNHFLDYISFDGVVGKAGAEDNSYPEYLALLGKLVRDGLKHHELSVREKYIWLHKKYAAQLKLIKGLEPDHFLRVKNPDLYLFYSAPPDHEDLAKSALK